MNKKHVPMRRCAGCMESRPKSELVRIVCDGDKIAVDRTMRMNGRGMYICNDPECLETAWKKNAVKRSFRRDIDKEQLDAVYDELKNREKEVSQ